MKWTQLRLNMLPITAVQIQFACESFIQLHNKIIQLNNKKINKKNGNANESTPVFVPAQRIMARQNQERKMTNGNKSNPEQEKMEYEKLINQYNELRKQMENQIKELDKFYLKYSHDASASLFHMLKLKLSRTLFDCTNQMNKNKKVLNKQQRQIQQKNYLKKFQSIKHNNSVSSNQFNSLIEMKNQLNLNSVTNLGKNNSINNISSSMVTDNGGGIKNSMSSKMIKKPQFNKDKVNSTSTFKTLSVDTYNQQISQNQFLDFQAQPYEKLNFDIGSNPKIDKRKEVQVNRNLKQNNNGPSSNTIKSNKKQPSRQTIQQNKGPKKLSAITNTTQSYKNLKNYPNSHANNNKLQSSLKPEQLRKSKQKSPNLKTQNQIQKNRQNFQLTARSKNDPFNNTTKTNKFGYSQMNQKKKNQTMTQTSINMKQTQNQKQKSLISDTVKQKSLSSNKKQLQKNMFKKSKQKVSIKNAIQKDLIKARQTNRDQNDFIQSKANQKFMKQYHQNKSRSPSNKSNKSNSGSKNKNTLKSQQSKNKLKSQQIDMKKFAQALSGQNANELRFTIKMSRQQYKSLLQMKSKMSTKSFH